MENKAKGLVSVIVPVYNVEPYLRKCLDSIVNQTYRALEIILVDDGSPDNCGVICDEYAARDGRIIVIHKENGGVSSARNAGLKRATGEWIGWVDPDDWIEPDMFEYLLGNILHYRADIAVCSRRLVYEDGKSIPVCWEDTELLNKEQGLEKLLKNELLKNYLCDKLFSRELLDRVVFPEGRIYEDIFVMHTLFEKAERVVCLPGIKYNYLQRPGSIVANVSLKNRMSHYIASKERYDSMKEAWPQLKPQLTSQCVQSAVWLWCAYYANPKNVRKEMLPGLKEVSAFCGPRTKVVEEHLCMGMAGRMVLHLLPYTDWWAFALARLVSLLYEKKHGRPL